MRHTIEVVATMQAYAMTEASHQMCSNPLPANGKRKPGSVGIAQGSIAVTILDEQSKPISRPNTAGEVAIRGPSIMSGYVNRKEASEEAFQGAFGALSLAESSQRTGLHLLQDDEVSRSARKAETRVPD